MVKQNGGYDREEITRIMSAIKGFRDERRGYLKPVTNAEVNFIDWRKSKMPRDWLAWYATDNKNTAYSTKAKLQRIMTNLINQKIIALEGMISTREPDTKSTVALAAEVYSMILMAKRYGIFDKNPREKLGRWRKWQLLNDTKRKRKAKKHRSKCKRETPNQLPLDWKEIIAEAMDYDPVVDLYACAGNRKSEVQTAELSMIDDQQLKITIIGSKVTATSGQEVREICPNMKIPAARRLAASIKKIKFADVNVEAQRARMGRLSQKLWGITVSPGCFRHSFAGEIKEFDGPNGNRLTLALGHISNRTDSRYGTRTGKTRVPHKDKLDPLNSVSASRPVKQTRSTTYRAQTKRQIHVTTLPDKP